MQTHLRRLAAIAAFTIGATVYSTIPSIAQDQEHRDSTQYQHTDASANHPDYSSNKFYRLGNQEGLQDHKRNTQRTSHNHQYKTDDDKKAHDYGYQEGWQGKDYRDTQRDPH
jgi:hypothetical protein